MRKFKRTTLIIIFCLSILAGLGLARKISFLPPIWLLIFTPSLLLLRHKNKAALIAMVLIGLGLGLWRGTVYMQKVQDLRQLTGRKVMIQASAITDSIYSKKSQIEFTANKVQLLEPSAKPLAGNFKISGFGTPMVYRGDTVVVSGKLFPMRGSNQARIAYAQLRTVGKDSSFINSLTRHFSSGMQNALPEPMASFGLGLLIGQRSTLPQDIITQLTMVGLVHIVAVSGYNVAILARAAARLKLGSKYQQLILSLGLITGFIFITGFSASIVRAAFVSGLSLMAWYYGRNIKPMVLISFAAAVTAMIKPFYIWGDLGWYLSFLAFFGVLVIAPIIAARFFANEQKLLSMVLLETLSAELMTLPLIMMTFSQLSLIAIIANILVVPLVPLAMLLTALAAAAGALAPQVSGWLAWPANLLLTYMLDLVHLLSNIPSVFIHASIGPVAMVSLYGLVIIAVLAAARQIKLKNAIITDEKN